MLLQTKNLTDEQLDKLSAEITRAWAVDETEIEQTAASPFLFRRIQAHIAAEENSRAQEGNIWLVLSRGLRRALPAFVLVAAFAIGGAYYVGSTVLSTANTAPSSTLDSLFYDGNDELFALNEGKR